MLVLILAWGAAASLSGVISCAAAGPVASGAFHADPGWFQSDAVERLAGRSRSAEAGWPVRAAASEFTETTLRATVDQPGAPPDSAPFAAAIDETVQVVGERPNPESLARRLPYHATVQRVETSTARMLAIADVLEDAAGVRVRRYGGLGSFATASIRGSSPGQVEIYLDGIPLNSAQWGATNLAELPIDNLAMVEIYRAGAPVGFGTVGLGGVVNLVTRDAATPRMRASFAGGSYGSMKATVVSSGPLGRFRHLVTIRHVRTRGDFRFLYNPGTPVLNEEDDVVLTRENNEFHETSVLVKIEPPPLGPWRVSFQDDWYLKEGGLAGHGVFLNPTAHFDTRRHRLSLTADAPSLRGATFGARMTAFATYNRDRTFNPAHVSYLNYSDLAYRTRSKGGQAHFTARWPRASQTLGTLLEIVHESFVPHDAILGAGFERTRQLVNVAIEDEWAPGHGRIVLLGSYRRRQATDNYFGPIPFGRPPEAREDDHHAQGRGHSLGARVDIGGGVACKLNRAEDVRFPTLFETFGTGGDVRANTNLAPESAVTWDAGASWQSPEGRGAAKLALGVTFFHSRRDSLIVFVQNSQRSFVAQNLESAIVRGIELQVEAQLGRRVTITGSHTIQEAHQVTPVPHWDGRWVPYVSPHELSVRTQLRTGPADLRYEFMRFGGYFQDRANVPEGRVAPCNLHSLGAAIQTGSRRVSLDVDLQNVLDRTMEDVYGYPMPGRTLYVTLECAFGRGN